MQCGDWAVDLVVAVVGTVFGGGALTAVIFWLKEKKFPLPDVHGAWFYEAETNYTGYKPYRNMRVRYEALLMVEGRRVSGAVEKYWEHTPTTGQRNYVGRFRTRGTIEGFIEKNYFGVDRVFLHVTEVGERRTSSTYHALDFNERTKRLEGEFNSLVARQSGRSTWTRSKPE